MEKLGSTPAQATSGIRTRNLNTEADESKEVVHTIPEGGDSFFERKPGAFKHNYQTFANDLKLRI